MTTIGATSRKTRAEDLRQQLADDIIMGRLPPGIRPDEIGIAKRFGVSPFLPKI
jgi:DNA-binding GntR family transcriptional regulator